MNLFTFIKKKEKNNKEDRGREKLKSPHVLCRLETQANHLHRKKPETSHIQIEQEQYEYQKKKIQISCKLILKMLMIIKDNFQNELQSLLIHKDNQKCWELHDQLLSVEFFRYRKVNREELLENYGNIIQACQLFYSKLYNNERVKEFFYVKDQKNFLQFFKHLFGKPYSLCNLPYFRKLLQTLWEKEIMPSLPISKQVEDMKLWAHGIGPPINPSSITLHKLVFGQKQFIPRYVHFLANEHIYHEINHSDCLGLTPLLLAAHANATNVYETLVKSHCDVYCCPLTIPRSNKKVSSSKKSDKWLINIDYPGFERKQFNFFQVMMHYQQYQQMVNILRYCQIRKLKDIKKDKSLFERLMSIPNGCFQIHWKTCKGLLSFKQLPKDIIAVYKKDGCLRIDYHIDNIQKVTHGHHSILLKTFPQKKTQYYYINHTDKKIINLMREVSAEKLKMRYQNITKYGNIEKQQISSIKSIYKEKNKSLETSIFFNYENVIKAELFKIKNLHDYEKNLINSEMIDYNLLDKSEMDCILAGNIGTLPKTKSKVIKQQTNMKIEFMEQKITLEDFLFVVKLLDSKSIFFIKLTKILEKLIEQPVYVNNLQLGNMTPMKMSINLESDYNLDIDIKNILYCELDDAVFGLQYRAKELEYNEGDTNRFQSLQETVFVDDCYSISVSQFLGKSESMLNLESEQAHRKFQELLTQEIDSFYQEEQK